MYDFNFIDNEELIDIFDNVLVIQDDIEKVTTIALTNKRLLFLDYLDINDGMEALRISRGVYTVRSKSVYYYINLYDIECVSKDNYYKIMLKNNECINFDNDILFKLLLKCFEK